METNLNVDSYINNAKNINQIVINDSKLGQIIINGASNNEFVSRIKYSNFRLYNSNDDMNYKLIYYKSHQQLMDSQIIDHFQIEHRHQLKVQPDKQNLFPGR